MRRGRAGDFGGFFPKRFSRVCKQTNKQKKKPTMETLVDRVKKLCPSFHGFSQHGPIAHHPYVEMNDGHGIAWLTLKQIRGRLHLATDPQYNECSEVALKNIVSTTILRIKTHLMGLSDFPSDCPISGCDVENLLDGAAKHLFKTLKALDHDRFVHYDPEFHVECHFAVRPVYFDVSLCYDLYTWKDHKAPDSDTEGPGDE
jgi:hypothetical protein